jgi:hypothetical protein
MLEPVAEALELRLVDRRRDQDHRRLDDLVLERGDAERPLSAIRLRNEGPAGWRRPIRPGMNTRAWRSRRLVSRFFPHISMPGAARQREERGRSRSTVRWCRSAVSFSLLFLLTASRVRACAWNGCPALRPDPAVKAGGSIQPESVYFFGPGGLWLR